ncbi:MAG: lytic murein transglycosylase [Pseudomonadota bacterium]|nr:lytic murein transglycosylase [Pseudomonadota bacterium]
MTERIRLLKGLASTAWAFATALQLGAALVATMAGAYKDLANTAWAFATADRWDAAFFAALEKRYGVPAGVILAIHGMETGFGRFMGDSNVVDAITTLAYDCRRPGFFTPHALAALQLVDRGGLSAGTLGAKHGEVGHTQFLPGNILKYGVDGNGDGRVDLTDRVDALASTANFLKKKGWRRGRPYQEGERNFKVIQEWNAATVYQQAIALMAARIDAP